MSTWETAPTASLEEAAALGPCPGQVALVPGDALGMRAVSERLLTVATGADAVGDLLRRVDAGEWRGESGDAFRATIGAMPGPYAKAARAFGAVGRALAELADTVTRSRATAQRAIEVWREAERATQGFEQDRSVWQAVGQDMSAFQARTGRTSLFLTDPGYDGRAEARRMLAQAQQDVEEADGRALRTILAATQDAPHANGWLAMAKGVRDVPVGTVTGLYGLTPLSDDVGENWGELASTLR